VKLKTFTFLYAQQTKTREARIENYLQQIMKGKVIIIKWKSLLLPPQYPADCASRCTHHHGHHNRVNECGR